MADATQVQRRRGTGAQCNAMTPAEGELIVDLTDDNIRVGDGTKAGGHITPNASQIQTKKYNFAVAGGTGNAIAVSIVPAPAALSQPFTITVKITATNTGATTCTVNSLSTVNVKKIVGGAAVDFIGGEFQIGGFYDLTFDGTQFIATGGGVGSGSATITAGSFIVAGTDQGVTYSNRLVGSVQLIGPRYYIPFTGVLRANLILNSSVSTTVRWLRNSTTPVGVNITAGSSPVSNTQSLSVTAGDYLDIELVSASGGLSVQDVRLSVNESVPAFSKIML